MTISEIVSRRDDARKAIQDKYWQARNRLLADLQAELDEVDRTYRAELYRHQCVVVQGEPYRFIPKTRAA